jgi:hypothetical protein
MRIFKIVPPILMTRAMSALPPKGDITKRRRDVCFVPKADIAARLTNVCFTPKSGHGTQRHIGLALRESVWRDATHPAPLISTNARRLQPSAIQPTPASAAQL